MTHGSPGVLHLGLRREDGVRVGGQLHIYRLEPRPEYVGRTKILEVRGTLAVGKLVSQVGLIQPGDFAIPAALKKAAPK